MGFKTVKIDGVCFSTGNTKLGAIPSVSTAPWLSCAKNGPRDCTRACYARKLARLRKNVALSWENNARVCLDEPAVYFKAVRTFLQRTRPLRFRWHVAGDITTKGYLDEMIAIARAFGAIRFLAFTKSYDLIENLPASTLPANLTVRASSWPGLKWRFYQTSILSQGYPVSYMVHPKETDSSYTVAIPKDVKVCPGSCVDCSLCWKKTIDVAFKAH